MNRDELRAAYRGERLRPTKKIKNSKRASSSASVLIVQVFICAVLACLIVGINNIKTEESQAFADGIKEKVSDSRGLEDVSERLFETFSAMPVFAESGQSETVKQAQSIDPEELDENAPDENSGALTYQFFMEENYFEKYQDEFYTLELASDEINSIIDSGADTPEDATFTRLDLNFRIITPLKGEVTSPFGYRDHPINGQDSFHYGIDIAAPGGTAIVSAFDGTVVETGKSAYYGNYIRVAYSEELAAFYGHCSELVKKAGDTIEAGETIAKVGSTGVSTGDHLHFEIKYDGIRLNPSYYVFPEDQI